MPASRLCGCQVVRQMIVSLVNSRPDGSSFHRPTCARRPGVGVAVPVRGGGHPDTHSGGGSVVHRPRAGARHHRGRPAGAQAAQYVDFLHREQDGATNTGTVFCRLFD